MPDSKLPELPAPRIKYGYEWKVPVAKYDYFDADQMRALQIATWNAAMEAAAVRAESDDFYGSATQHLIADAIRALKEPQ